MSDAVSFPAIDILLFFGSFNPLTIAHEALIQTALETVNPHEVWLIPAAKQGWGKQLVSFPERDAMINAAIAAHDDWKDRVSVCPIEYEYALSGITADTLHFLRKTIVRGRKIGLLMGSDWVISLPTWEEWLWMLEVAPGFVALRADESEESLLPKLTEKMQTLVHTNVFFLPETHTAATKAVSSTLVRSQLKEQGVTALVSAPVASYIEEHQLYRG